MANLKWLNIPQELRDRPQWAVATLEPILDANGEQVLSKRGKPRIDKAPRNPHTGQLISVNNRSSFVTFHDAINSGYAGIGFILTAEDPFTIIDLDQADEEKDREAQRLVFESLPSYSELSVSGEGLHIICYGRIQGGFNRGGIEIYDQERFILCTGNTVTNYPVANHQDMVIQLASEMGYRGRPQLFESEQENFTDDVILAKMHSAKNAEKFKDLFYRSPGLGDDWSQRDASLAQMIAHYTRNHEQALRIFRQSALYRPMSKGKGPEHYEQYYLLERTFGRAWEAERAKDANVAHGAELAKKVLAHSAQKYESNIHFPPGLVGEVADFIYKASPRPVKEIALAGAITFCSGLLGRQYNVSRSGLNIYTVLVAQTGRGKEAAASGVDSLMHHVRTEMPIIDSYRGPGHIASGQALLKAIANQPAMFAFLAEFGHTIESITNPRANAADVRTRQVLLDLFTKSGQNQILQSSIYSDTDKNTKPVAAPCFAFMGDTTPEVYFKAFSSDLMAEGLLPRFLTIHYDGPRVPSNPAPISMPTKALLEHLKSVVTTIANMAANHTFVDVEISPQAKTRLNAFDVECDNRINIGGPDAEIWNRAHLKVLRLAALVAVGRDHFHPGVTLDDVEWAIHLVTMDINKLKVKEEDGTIGDDESKQLPEIIKATIEYLKMAPQKRGGYGWAPKVEGVVPYSFYRRRFRNVAAFRKDRLGASTATKKALQDAVDIGVLERLTMDQSSKLGTTTELFTPGPSFPVNGYIGLYKE